MNARAILELLRSRSITLSVSGDRLLFQAPPGAMTEDLLGLVRQHKAALMTAVVAQDAVLVPRTSGQSVRASFAQQRLWFLNQLDPAASAAYQFHDTVTLRGVLDREALRRALDRIIERHEALRTHFVARNGEAVMAIAPETGFPLAEHDLRDYSAEARSSQLATLLQQARVQPFDLAQGPLIRGHLYRISAEHHVLLITQHHINTDGWSQKLFLSELSALYAAFTHGLPDRLPPPTLQYADYALWQRQYLQGEVLERQLSFWREHLKGAPPLIELPTDYPRPVQQSYRGATVALELSAPVTQRLRQFAQRHGVTLFMGLLAAWSVLLMRLSGQKSVVVGTPVANRQRRELEPLIGFFANTLALKVDLEDEPRIDQLMARLRAVTLEAYAHQDLPFEQVVEALQPPRGLGHNPLFQVMLAFNNTPNQGSLQLAGLEVEADVVAEPTTHFDLELTLTDRGDHLAGGLTYASDLFERGTAQRLARQLETVLTGMMSDDRQRVSEIALLTEAERHRLVVDLNSVRIRYPTDTTVHRLFEEQVLRDPARIAIASEEGTLSYEELNRRANRVAHWLLEQGVRPDQRVALCTRRSPQMLVGMLGILKAGAAYVPLDPVYPAERLAFMLADSQPRVILTQCGEQGRLPTDTVPVLLLDGAELSTGRADNPDPQALGVTARHLAYVIYTSGSTGMPKGVMTEHRQLCHQISTLIEVYGLGPSDRVLQFASMAFDMSVEEIFGALLSAGTLVLRTDEWLISPVVFAERCAHHGITVVSLPTAFWSQIAGGALPESLRQVVIGGEAVGAAALGAWFDHPGYRPVLLNTYGPTETTVNATLQKVSARSLWSSIGRPLPGVRIYVLDDRREPVPVGAVGELYIGGEGVARGYLGRKELTEERFVADPFSGEAAARMYRTGDLGRYRTDDSIEYLGRNDQQIKIRGFRIEPGEIEARLLEHPWVKEALVVAREDAPGEKRLVAYVVGVDEGGEGVDSRSLLSQLRTHLLAHLPEYMVPVAFVQLPGLPLTPSGKLDRKRLPVPDESAVLRRGYAAPENAVERLLVGIWQELLRVGQVGRYDHFFELGGHSLLAVQLIARVRAALSVEIALQEVFTHPTLADFAEQVSREAAAPAAAALLAPVEKADRQQPLPLSWSQHRLWFLDQLNPAASVAYHLPVVLRLQGRLDRVALREAFQRILDRHEVLRTSFQKDEQGRAVQEIAAVGLPFPLQEQDLRSWPEREREGQAKRIAQEEAQQPFEMTRAPLIRARLVCLAEDEHLLLVTQHHIVSDAWSLEVLSRELATLYSAFSAGRSDPLPALAVQYADYALWQRQYLRGEVLERQLSFWREHLKGAPPLIELPTDYPRPVQQSYRGATVALGLSAPVTKRLREFAQHHGVTLFMGLLAAWSVLLMRLSGQQDLVIGTPVANRRRQELEALSGFFVNTLALRIPLEGDPRVGPLLESVKKLTLEAYAHQDLPFEQVVEALQPPRGLSHNPLFQVMLALDNTSGTGELRLPGLQVSPVVAEDTTTHFDLSLSFTDRGDYLAGGLTYASDLFERRTAQRLVRQFETVLTGMMSDDRQRVSEIALLTEAERRRVLFWDHADRLPAATQELIHESFESQVIAHPQATAVRYHDQELTYDELNRWANRIAHRLVALGARPDDRVAVVLDRGPAMVAGLLGVLKSGSGYVPLDPAYPADRLSFFLKDSVPRVLVTTSSLQKRLRVSELPVLLLDDILQPAGRDDNPDPAVLGVTARHLAYVIYTSGTTGRPKGVMVEHRNVTHLLSAARQRFDFGPLDTWSVFHSMAFDFSVWEIWGALAFGGRLVVVPVDCARSPTDFYELLCDEKVTILNQTPAAFSGLPPAQIRSVRQHSLRMIIFGGEALEFASLRPWVAGNPLEQTALINMYGITEITVHATHRKLAAADIEGHGGSVIGTALPGLRVYLLDEHLQPVPVGVRGELYISGHGVARGYLNRPELTHERFLSDPFGVEPDARMYRTGDVARWRADGDIEYLGRNDGQIKLRGFRIELGEIESRLLECAGVKEAVVIVRDDGQGERRLVAYLTANGLELSVAGLRNQLGRALPEYMLPGAFVILPALPLTPNGKVDRAALPAPDLRAVVARVYEEPQGEIESEIASVWCELLGLDRVGRQDHFFELGGHSLLAVQLQARLRDPLGVEVPLQHIFLHPTVQSLADQVTSLKLAQYTEQDRAAVESALAALSESELRRLIQA
ncbi:MAG TPA: amino acid adenylation domain-containing protein [Steroidobacteraceae bacterium]